MWDQGRMPTAGTVPYQHNALEYWSTVFHTPWVRDHTWRLRNFVFSTKPLVGNTCGVAEFCLFMNYLIEVYSVSERGTPYRLYGWTQIL